MKKIFTAFALFAATLTVSAQQKLYICDGFSYKTEEVKKASDITFTSDKSAIVINSTEYKLADIDSITPAEPIFKEVKITYSSSGAKVEIPAYVKGVTSSVSGANVTLTSTNTADEILYTVSGTSTNGSLTINGEYKLSLQLAGLDLTSATSAPIDIECGKRVNLIVKDGTVNNIADAAAGSQKACLYCKGHMEVSGSGTLNVSGNKSHAISTKEYLQIKKSAGTINIQKSANDAFHIGQYLMVSGGKITITDTTVGDGIQVDKTSDMTDEYNGEIIIRGGTFDITMTSQDTKAIKTESNIAISGGTFTLNANGNGTRGIQTDANMTIGTEDGKTNILVNATGTRCTIPDDADDPHNCMGIKVDGDLTINGGTVTVYNTGKKSKGIKVAGVYANNGGNVTAAVENK